MKENVNLLLEREEFDFIDRTITDEIKVYPKEVKFFQKLKKKLLWKEKMIRHQDQKS